MTDETRRWFGGLPVVASRTLTEEERAHVAELRDDFRKAVWKSLGLLGLLIGTSLLQIYWRNSFGIVIVLIALLRGGPIRLQGYRGLASAMARDIAAGMVEICEEGPIRIEVLPQSHVLLRHNGLLKDELVILSAGSTAGVPEHAKMAANFVRPVNETTSVHQRILSDDELRELRGYLPRLPFGRLVLVATAIAGLIASAILAWFISPDAWVLFAIFGIVVFFSARPVVHALRERSDVARDAAERVVVIVKVTHPNGSSTVEVLPRSGILWTEEALPASWRRMR